MSTALGRLQQARTPSGDGVDMNRPAGGLKTPIASPTTLASAQFEID
ncbi:hypothetical protein [Variovorax rhizosphaerae]|uniref:Uncharacterized protein n=1 Tax=Variovorax rhizosphaerae TaxID=1836200 RepID=A0ABU8WKZ2_9BURK